MTSTAKRYDPTFEPQGEMDVEDARLDLEFLESERARVKRDLEDLQRFQEELEARLAASQRASKWRWFTLSFVLVLAVSGLCGFVVVMRDVAAPWAPLLVIVSGMLVGLGVSGVSNWTRGWIRNRSAA